MGFSGSVQCSCLQRGLITPPEELREAISINSQGDVREPPWNSPLHAAWRRWTQDACPHRGLTACNLPLGNNRAVGVLELCVERLVTQHPHPTLLALQQVIPQHHGSMTPPELAEEALPGIDRAIHGLSRLTVSGLQSPEGLLWWSLGTSMTIWLASGPPPLSARVEAGQLSLLVEGEVRLRGAEFQVERLDDALERARMTDTATGQQAELYWPYDTPILRGYTGPLPVEAIAPTLETVRALLQASVEQQRPVWWG